MPRVQQEYQALAREYETTQEMYKSLTLRERESALSEKMEAVQKGEKFRVIETARPSEEPAAPKRPRLFALALLLALAAAGAAIFGPEALDSSVHSLEQLQARCELPVLVAIPRIVGPADLRRQRKRFVLATAGMGLALAGLVVGTYLLAKENPALTALLIQVTAPLPMTRQPFESGEILLSAEADPKLVTLLHPDTFAADQYRVLRHLIEEKRNEGLSVMAVTSPTPEDGKTLTAINLAGCLSEAVGSRVLLVDADLRRPSVLERLGMGSRTPRGLVDLVADEHLRLEDVVRRIARTNLFLLPPGKLRTSPYEVLKSARLASLFTEARTHLRFGGGGHPSHRGLSRLSSRGEGRGCLDPGGGRPPDPWGRHRRGGSPPRSRQGPGDRLQRR